MKIKYYHIKNNGEIAKTPSYFDAIDRKFTKFFFDYEYWTERTLFDDYKKIANLEEKYFGDIYVEKIKIPYKKFRQAVLSTIAAKRLDMDLYLRKLEGKLDEIRFDFRGVCDDIDRYVKEKDNLVNEHERVVGEIEALRKDTLVGVPDITALTPEDLLEFLEK